ncbi:MAG: exodeoxyribonuclease VII large subunit [Lachnospiraceae bacterium]|nr:exodeoxyribonuclease VII large subunit [Lachnospiraceae bacterium]
MGSVYSVTQINSYIKNMFSQDYLLHSVYVKGEVSNVKYHSSGHIYFTMKDSAGTLACVMFAGNRSGLKFTMQEGQQIICGGSVDIYQRDGKYQLYAKEITLDGAGALYEKYEKLKAELEEMGMFSDEYKKKIPKFSRRIGVITAKTGAAIQDIINISKRRNPYVQLVLYPATVQGDGAAETIVNGIRALDRDDIDVIIVGRGGGSIEDLWAFNEEIVARAIFDCSTPIVSAVGHETDFTIADFVSDLRAPTPSAAAELTVFSISEFDAMLDGYKESLKREMLKRIQDKKLTLERYKLLIDRKNPETIIREKRMQYIRSQERLIDIMHEIINRKRHTYELLIEQMKALSPLEKLSSGYAHVENSSGATVKSVQNINIGDKLKLSLKDGTVLTEVIEVNE